MLKFATISFISLVTCSTDFLGGPSRILKGDRGKSYYGENVKINYQTKLGCGSCIKSGYIYCIPGAEGTDSSTWPPNLKATCCKDLANCPEAKLSTYLCSNTYTDTTLAKAMCPFSKPNCGKSSSFVFDEVNQVQDITISLPQGDTCAFLITAKCGLPSFKPNDTTGFDIETIDYDEDDLASTNNSNVPHRMLYNINGGR